MPPLEAASSAKGIVMNRIGMDVETLLILCVGWAVALFVTLV